MYKSTPITQKCKSSPARFYTPPGVNQDLISGAGTSSDKFTTYTDEDKKSEDKKAEDKKAETESVKQNTVSRQRNPAQQARYEGRKERQSIRQKGRAERIKDKNISRNKSVQDRVDKKNEHLNKTKKPINVSKSKRSIDLGSIIKDQTTTPKWINFED